MQLVTTGTLYTIGYSNPGAAAHVARLMRDERTLLLDIRYSPRSRWSPEWNRRALAARYGQCYLWDQRLGNVNYQHHERGIELSEQYPLAVRAVASLLSQGTSLILLCACKNARTCHRSLVAKLVQDALSEMQYEGVSV